MTFRWRQPEILEEDSGQQLVKVLTREIVRALAPSSSMMPASLMISGLVPNTTATEPASRSARSMVAVTRSPARTDGCAPSSWSWVRSVAHRRRCFNCR